MYLDLPRHLELNAAAYYVGAISPPSGQNRVEIPSYVRLDLGVVWHPVSSLEFGVWGQNLLHRRHAEFASVQSSLLTEVPRGIMVRMTWRY